MTNFVLHLRDSVICGKVCFTKRAGGVFNRITFAVATTTNCETVYFAYISVPYQQC